MYYLQHDIFTADKSKIIVCLVKKENAFFILKKKMIVIRFKKKENKIFICLEKKVNKQIVISDFTTRIGVKHTVRGFGEIVILVL